MSMPINVKRLKGTLRLHWFIGNVWLGIEKFSIGDTTFLVFYFWKKTRLVWDKENGFRCRPRKLP
jgi:hypothetical protein